MKELLTQLCEHLERNDVVVMATVIHQEGSTPRGAGSKMLVTAQGLLCGTIGGGLAEAEAIKVCMQVLHSEQCQMLDFTLTGEIAANSEMICGGLLKIFMEPILPTPENKGFFRKVLEGISAQETTVLTQILDGKIVGRSLRLDAVWEAEEGQKLHDADKNSVCAHLTPRQDVTFVTKEQGQAVVVEKYPPLWQMIIAGGGHVSLFTAKVAALAGFSVVVLDDREEFSAAQRFPEASATHTVPNFAHCFAHCTPTKYSCVVIVTRGHVHDKTVLEQALQTKAGYIGMIGSKRKRRQVYDALLAQGVTQAALDKVYCPIGLGIKAETPEEIAISIVAECIAHRREAWDILQP